MRSSRFLTEALYERYQRDRRALHPGWRRYFDEIEGTPREVQPAAVLDHLPHVASVALFRDLPLSEQALVASAVEPLELQAEQVLFRAGDAGDALYVVTSGTLRVMRGGSVLGLIGIGEVAGELAVVDKKPRSADVIGHQAATLLKLPAAAFDELVARNPELASGLMKILAGRMRSANAQQERVDLLIRSYRNRGHVIARLDPLGRGRTTLDELELEYHGLSEAELDLPFSIRTAEGERTLLLRAIVDTLRTTYCRTIGVQFMHIDDRRVREWLQFRMEGSQNHRKLSLAEQRRILTKLTDAELFEQFIHKKFLGAKRFSLEGGESLIPLLDMAIEDAAGHGITEMVIGMAHRGRLNVLANVMGKSPRQIFEEFKQAEAPLAKGGGDVKYHMGYSSDRVTSAGR